ncbi:MAG TPA: PilX N-terminal domain-containing pilus assembly protein [Candidatus Binatia bacterium]|nr:PilX N-terminal domain-containing pilus assembly protein [Candidatus Binatia bacterium]
MTGDRRSRKRGFALVLVLVIMTLLMAMGAALHSGIMADTTLRSGHQIATQGFYAAEAGVNLGINTYRQIFLNQQMPQPSDYNAHTFMLGPRTVTYQLCQYGSGTTGCPTDASWTQGEQQPVPSGRQFTGMQANEYKYINNSNSQLVMGDIEATLGSEFEVDQIPIFQWLAFYANDLEILPGPNMNLHGPIHTNGNLYLNSNATLTVTNCNNTAGTGTVNYCAAAPPGVATVRVTAAGDIYRGRKDTGNSPTCGGTVNIGMAQDTSPKDGWLDLRAMPCGGSSSSDVLQTAAMLANWLGTVKSHVQKITVPQPSAFAYLAPAPSAWSKADLRIVLDWNHPDTNGRYAIFAADSSGNVDLVKTTALQTFMVANPGDIFYNDVPTSGNTNNTACTTAGSYCNPASYSPAISDAAHVYACAHSVAGCGTYIANAALTTGTLLASGSVTARRGGFYDYREGAWLRMLNVNPHDLLQWNRAQGGPLFDPNDTTDGGIVLFLTVLGPGSTGIPTGNNPPIRYAVRIFGSSDLNFPSGMADPTGLTVVSDQAAYVEGNYNVGTVTNPKMPAAVIGDTINVLSAYWSRNSATANDYQSYQTTSAYRQVDSAGCVGPPRTCDTSINAAFIGGVNPTSGAQYSGGFENYPRFHEDWSGSTGGPALIYRGSFVSFGAPLHNNGNWSYGLPIYTAPVRNWDYDTDFQSSALLPPLTPMAVGVEQILFTENFK